MIATLCDYTWKVRRFERELLFPTKTDDQKDDQTDAQTGEDIWRYINFSSPKSLMDWTSRRKVSRSVGVTEALENDHWKEIIETSMEMRF